MIIHLHIIAVSLLVLAVVHSFSPRYFQWRTEVAGLTLLTQQVFFVHHAFIGITVGLMVQAIGRAIGAAQLEKATPSSIVLRS